MGKQGPPIPSARSQVIPGCTIRSAASNGGVAIAAGRNAKLGGPRNATTAVAAGSDITMSEVIGLSPDELQSLDEIRREIDCLGETASEALWNILRQMQYLREEARSTTKLAEELQKICAILEDSDVRDEVAKFRTSPSVLTRLLQPDVLRLLISEGGKILLGLAK